MIIKAESTIDLDGQRKVWLQISAKIEEHEDPAEALPVIAQALVDQSISAFEQAAAQLGMPGPPDPLQTFGDD